MLVFSLNPLSLEAAGKNDKVTINLPQNLFLVDKDGICPHRDDFNELLEYKILGKIDSDFIILPCCLKSERVQGKNEQGQNNPAGASGFRLGGCGL